MDALSLPLSLLHPAAPAAARVVGAVVPDQIKKVAEDFEASFLNAMLQPVFNSLSTEAPFGGGSGEAAFKSFMVDEMAKQTAKRGGVGLAEVVQRELLRMQGAGDPAAASAPTAPETAA